MGTIEKKGTKEFLKPAKISKTRLAQLKRIWKLEGFGGKDNPHRIPLMVWLRKDRKAYVALDWNLSDETKQPMLSFFTKLPYRFEGMETLSSEDFVCWLPISTSQAKDWNETKAYSLESLYE